MDGALAPEVEIVAGSNGSLEDPRARLTELRNGLLRLHGALLDSERELYERDIERIHTSNRLLDLVLNDPAFAWLREISKMVVLIDEILEADTPPSSTDADRLIAQARDLLSPGQGGGSFETRYLEAMQRDPGVILAHAEALRLLRSLQ